LADNRPLVVHPDHTEYMKRAGIEGTISQGTRGHDFRRSRYEGLAKTGLLHLCIGVVMNFARVAA
jgi:transposase